MNETIPNAAVKLHVLLLNILVRISMEPTVRQTSYLRQLLENAALSEAWRWRCVNSRRFEPVLNWFVMSVDPRVVLQIPDRNPVDIALIRLLHVCGSYWPLSSPIRFATDCDASAKRQAVLRCMIRLVSTAATRHKALLSASPSLFARTYEQTWTHMHAVANTVLPCSTAYVESVSLCSEALSLLGGVGIPPTGLASVCRDALVQWLRQKGPDVEEKAVFFLRALAEAVSRVVLHLQHRNALLHHSIAAIFNHAAGSGRPCVHWRSVVPSLCFPVTNPAAMLDLAAQENHLLVIFAHTKWRLRVRSPSPSERTFVLSNLVRLIVQAQPDDESETWLLLLLGEILDLIQEQVCLGSELECVWRECASVASLTARLGQDGTDSLLAKIGLGRTSPLTPRCRIVCRGVCAFLSLQLVYPGFFRNVNEHRMPDVEEYMPSNEFARAVPRLLNLRSQPAYASVTGLSAVYDLFDAVEDDYTARHCAVFFDKVLLDNLYEETSILRTLRSEHPEDFEKEDLDKELQKTVSEKDFQTDKVLDNSKIVPSYEQMNELLDQEMKEMGTDKRDKQTSHQSISSSYEYKLNQNCGNDFNIKETYSTLGREEVSVNDQRLMADVVPSAPPACDF